MRQTITPSRIHHHHHTNAYMTAGLIFAWIASLHSAWAIQTTLDLFPSSYEEYDDLILDPEHGFGSPFGGFSRATRSRLASLPLILPETDSETTPLEAFHTQVRDAQGRLFVCRVYHEDELEAGSVLEGMFEMPRLQKLSPSLKEEAAGGADAKESAKASSILDRKTKEAVSSAQPSQSADTDAGSDSIEEGVIDETYSPGSETEQALDIKKILDPLNGLCAQTHKGWWSYEWCYMDGITQFHVEINKMTSAVQVQDITSLGDFDSRRVILPQQQSSKGENTYVDPNFLAQGRVEVARVQDTYLHGSLCPETSKERESVVNLMCCSKTTLQRKKGLVHRENIHVNTDLMAIYDVEESKTSLCSYNVTVCTPLLCEDHHKENSAEKGNSIKESATGEKLKDPKSKPGAPPRENESVMEILLRTLDGFCLQTSTGGWWTYEICHKKSIRQYHEVVGSRKNKNGAIYTSREIEADHNLGNYRANVFNAIVPEDEWKFVVNATDKKGGAKKPYFELEYIGGDKCDHSDVTDAAIVAGGGSGSEGIFRASSVRYQCGDTYEVSVSEDTTCHYIVWVDLPDLCYHPFFKMPVSKKQVFKCLHVPEDMEQEEGLALH